MLLHELVHVNHCNQGKQFWQELDGLMGNARALDRKLDTYNVLLLSLVFWKLRNVGISRRYMRP